MPLDYETTPGAPCWAELYTSRTDEALAFYRELFGWEAEGTGEEFGGYINITKDGKGENGKGIAGCMHNDGSSGAPDGWVVYLTTPDVQRTAEEAKAGGGQEVVPPMDVMDLGTMAFLIDAGGAAVGGWQPGTHKGFEVMGGVGEPYYFELHTRAYQPAVEFYRRAFAWPAHETSPDEDFPYTTLSGSGVPLAGIMDVTSITPADVPPSWFVYFRVEDADAALDKVADLGGEVIYAAQDSPYGRIAHVADPTGPQFKIISTK